MVSAAVGPCVLSSSLAWLGQGCGPSSACSAMIANRALDSAGGGLARWGSGTGTGPGATCGIAGQTPDDDYSWRPRALVGVGLATLVDKVLPNERWVG